MMVSTSERDRPGGTFFFNSYLGARCSGEALRQMPWGMVKEPGPAARTCRSSSGGPGLP